MTNEEAALYMKLYKLRLVDFVSDGLDKDIEAYNTAIKALEQEPILDKIRSEIEQTADEEQKHDEKWARGLRYAVKIIDKYSKEQEDADSD